MKPLINEGDVVVMLEPSEHKVYYVEKVESISYDYAFSSAVATSTLGSFTEIANLEPPQKSDPEVRMYQWRAGIKAGQVYVEILSGAIRRTLYRQQKPTSSAPYVGYFDEVDSPFKNPKFEFFLKYSERPAFAVYNKWGFSITPVMSFRGRHLKMYDLEKPSLVAGRLPYMGLNHKDWEQISEDALSNKRISYFGTPHRRITALGVD